MNIKNQTLYFALLFTAIILTVLLKPFAAKAIPVTHYASASVLSEGQWARVDVKATGMHFISNATLSSLGFQNPSKVNVYGYGGQPLSEKLNETDYIDDLPCLPVVRTDKGILFFAVDNVAWSPVSTGQLRYSRNINVYSDHSYYFLSDRDTEPVETASIPAGQTDMVDAVTSFRRRVLHESEMAYLAQTGCDVFGEDFRTQSSRTFNFNLPGNTGTDVVMKVQFAAAVTGGSSDLMFTANGNRLPSSNNDKISAVTSSDDYYKLASTVKSISDAGEKLSIGIQYGSSGAISSARLDYIQVEYDCALSLPSSGELYFYANIAKPSTFAVDGCSSATILWDVTDPVRPVKIEYELTGSKAIFHVDGKGYREFVAFNPASVTTAPAGTERMANQNIHGLEVPEMVIITPPLFEDAAESIADIHRTMDGMKVHILHPEDIYNEFSSGVQHVGALRKLLKMWWDRSEAEGGNFRYCLILSRPTYDHKGLSDITSRYSFTPVPIYMSSGSTARTYSTDDFIMMLEDNPAGETFNMRSARFKVSVGRMPLTTVSQANAAVEKLRRYVMSTDYGTWRNNALVIADDLDSGVHLRQAEQVVNSIQNNGYSTHFNIEKLYFDTFERKYTSGGATYPDATARFLKKLNDGVFYVDYIGHGNPKEWSHERFFTWEDMNALSNSRLPFLLAATCDYLRWDEDDMSGGELIWHQPYSGVIAMICPSRSVYISQNGTFNTIINEHVFARDEKGLPLRIGDIYLRGKDACNHEHPLIRPGQTTLETAKRNAESVRDNNFRYSLMGDPAMRLGGISYTVETDAIAEIDVNDEEAEYPEIPARSRFSLSGHIKDPKGEVASDYNGTLEISLYDAEKVVTTLGNHGASENDYKIETFNDRSSRLYFGAVKVIDGRWSADINMPPLISNNYSPARLTFYAVSENGTEANGSSEKLYVYGMSEQISDDTEGPEISELYLNNPSFTSGDVVNSRPVLYVTVEDESGINISDTGIGHSMLITVDGKTFFKDVADYFIPDPANPAKGHVIYPISELSAGKHTLSFSVWDNADNSSEAMVEFNVGVGRQPGIVDLTTDVNPAKTDVTFSITTDRPMTMLSYLIEVFDLNGKKMWSETLSSPSGIDASVNVRWDLRDTAGSRVQRGIYLYRVTVETPEGTSRSGTKKLAVCAE